MRWLGGEWDAHEEGEEECQLCRPQRRFGSRPISSWKDEAKHSNTKHVLEHTALITTRRAVERSLLQVYADALTRIYPLKTI